MPRMPKWNDHRTAVLDALKQRRKTRYWLAKQMTGILTKAAVYGYLDKKFDIGYEKQHAMSKLLGIHFTDE